MQQQPFQPASDGAEEAPQGPDAKKPEQPRSTPLFEPPDDLDRQDIQQSLAGDREAFGRIAERYAKPLHGITFAVLRDWGWAED